MEVMAMTEGEQQSDVLRHKEEGNSRIQTDNTDREKIKNKLVNCIDPFEPESHPESLVNIVTGQVSPDIVNVDSSLQVSLNIMHTYRNGWPDSFHKPLSKPIALMPLFKKQNKIDNVHVFYTTLIY